MNRRIERRQPKTGAELARERAGLTLAEAARLARVCPAYLRQMERSGGTSYVLAYRLSSLYACSIMIFLRFDLGGRKPK